MHVENKGSLAQVRGEASIPDEQFYLFQSPRDEVFARLWSTVNNDIKWFEPGNGFGTQRIFELTNAGVMSGVLNWEQASELYNQAEDHDGIALQDFQRWFRMVRAGRVSDPDDEARLALEQRVVSDWHGIVTDPRWTSQPFEKLLAQAEFYVHAPISRRIPQEGASRNSEGGPS